MRIFVVSDIRSRGAHAASLTYLGAANAVAAVAIIPENFFVIRILLLSTKSSFIRSYSVLLLAVFVSKS